MDHSERKKIPGLLKTQISNLSVHVLTNPKILFLVNMSDGNLRPNIDFVMFYVIIILTAMLDNVMTIPFQ